MLALLGLLQINGISSSFGSFPRNDVSTNHAAHIGQTENCRQCADVTLSVSSTCSLAHCAVVLSMTATIFYRAIWSITHASIDHIHTGLNPLPEPHPPQTRFV
jgi:hypothetical protein